MASPNYSRMSVDQLTAFVNKMVLAFGAGPTNPYGIDSDLVGALTNANAALSTAATTAGQRKDAYAAALRDRDAREAATAALAAMVTRMVLANPDLTPAQLAQLGLSPRSKARPRVVPVAPTQLATALLPTGDVKLAWSSASPYGVVYRVEAQVGTEPWTFVDETTAKRITLSGFAPGVPTAFRIVASKNGTLSAPSPAATIYYAPASPALRLAA